MNYDISIIIPLYNSENTIEKCLHSIFSQTTNLKYEVIIVDDGSTDKTVIKVEKNIFGKKM